MQSARIPGLQGQADPGSGAIGRPTGGGIASVSPPDGLRDCVTDGKLGVVAILVLLRSPVGEAFKSLFGMRAALCPPVVGWNVASWWSGAVVTKRVEVGAGRLVVEEVGNPVRWAHSDIARSGCLFARAAAVPIAQCCRN